jgi:hypothetical protein
MLSKLFILIVCSQLFNVSISLADQFSYMCEIKSVFTVSESGSLIPYNGESALIGQKIAIDRQNGRIIGNRFANGNSDNITILDKGSHEQAFKLVSVWRFPFVHVDYIQVEEFAKGKKKPFVGISGGMVYSGFCE